MTHSGPLGPILDPPPAESAMPDRDKPGRIERVARRLKLTEGQLYTYAIGVVVALVGAVGGIRPTLHW